MAGNKTTDGAGAGSFTSSITGLVEGGTLYYVRAYATNSAGTGYGMAMAFRTSAVIPEVTTAPVTGTTQTTAECGGNVISDKGALVTARGVCWSENVTPTVEDSKTIDGTGVGSFTSAITGMTGNKEYYVRAYATNSVGTGYGMAMAFRTSAVIPEVTTALIAAVTQTSAQCGGTVTSDGGATVTARGVCWSTNATPTLADDKSIDGDGTGGFNSLMTNLTMGTHYFVRAYATNSAGTGYGMAVVLTTTDSTGIVTDIDGNSYETVKIGGQWWMAENLKAIHYRNGDSLSNVTGSADWMGLTTGAYCNYNNDEGNVAAYGRLYNSYAVSDARNIAPLGWHVPTDDEWQTLTDFLMGSAVAGGKMKETGTTYWLSPNTGATNESGFSGLPGGDRIAGGDLAGNFGSMGDFANFWSSTNINDLSAWYRSLKSDNSECYRSYCSRRYGFSVRCVRD